MTLTLPDGLDERARLLDALHIYPDDQARIIPFAQDVYAAGFRAGAEAMRNLASEWFYSWFEPGSPNISEVGREILHLPLPEPPEAQ